jgi:hypothetical protein
MIAYRPQERCVQTRCELEHVRGGVEQLSRRATPDHAAIQEILIHLGEIESGVMDAMKASFDSPEAQAFRCAMMAAGRLLCRSWRGGTAGDWIIRCLRALDQIAVWDLPTSIVTSVPEGYAYYGLFPEMYIEAAERFWSELRPEAVTVIGIRSIGASLSAVVAGRLAEFGCRVRSGTVRPAGHPFDRVAHIPRAVWKDVAPCWFAVVDEGPGLSGSSFAAVSKALESIGAPDERVVLFPAWDADPARFVNESARAQWARHRKYIGSFRTEWLDGELQDFSAGKWRAATYSTEKEFPAAQPQHERRKFLDGGGRLLKFEGLGRYGRARFTVATSLADAGFSPFARSFSNGFVSFDFAPGRPLRPGRVSIDVLDRIASYAAFRARQFSAERSLSFDEIAHMVEVNARETLGVEPSGLGAVRAEFNDRPAAAVDGRMLPHEWLHAGPKLLKTDAADHCADHFFPGGADILWDIAGAAIEFQLNAQEREFLFERYRAVSGDCPSRDLLNFYEVAYLAFRLGYSNLAARATTGTADHERFKILEASYRRMMAMKLNVKAPVCLP